MKKLKNTLFLCFGIMILLFSLSSCDSERAESVLHEPEDTQAISYGDVLYEIDIKSPQGFVYDVKGDCFIFEKGRSLVVYPGSTSKLLTVLYALSVLEPEMVVTAGDELDFVKEGSSVAYIKKGHQLTVEMLVQAMLLPSGNDAAYVLAAAVGREIKKDCASSFDEITAFLEGVNAYGKALGLCGTYITVPDGYADEEHYTTIEDMAIIAKTAMKNPIIAKYASMYTAQVKYASGHTNTWVNTNKLLDESGKYYSPYAVGLKTGSIGGEYSLVFAFVFDDGREYIAGVFGADEKNVRFEDAKKVIDFFENLQE